LQFVANESKTNIRELVGVLNRLITLSPLTDMARNFHLRNGAIEIQVNESTQNFEYKKL